MSVPERVQFHMVLTAMLYQYTARNSMQQQNDFLKHYRYALSFYPELLRDTSLAGMQALTLVVIVLRAYPRPGAAWMISTYALTKAVEMGLHRSAKAWKETGSEPDSHHVEMRKRVFWSILACHVIIGTALGRPLVLRVEDFDTEMPQPIHDALPEELSSLNEWQKCSFRIAIYGFGNTVLSMQIYTSIYTVRPAPQQPYERMLKRHEKELQSWHASMPPELRESQLDPQLRVFALYMDHAYQHLRLVLHHPALCRTSDPELTAHNLDICLEASSKLLSIASDMRSLKSLDSTWFNTTIFLAAIFTTLFAYLERRDRITSAEYNTLSASMDSWIDIMGDIGQLLGEYFFSQVMDGNANSSEAPGHCCRTHYVRSSLPPHPPSADTSPPKPPQQP